MLRLENIDKFFGPTTLFKGASLHVRPQEKVGIVGPNGSGKTTLFRLIEGSQGLEGGRLTVANLARIGVLRQELEASHRPLLAETLEGDPELVTLRRERSILQRRLEEEPFTSTELTDQLGRVDHRLEEIGGFDAESRAGSILLGLGFTTGDLTRPLADFSGGWRMRVALARLLFSRADLMLLDEPTNHLDLESIAWLERHLVRLNGTLLVISHDRGFLNRVTNLTVALEHHRLVRYSGSYDQYEKERSARRSLLLKAVEKQNQEIEQVERFIQRFRAQATKAKQVQSRVKQLEKIERLAPPPPEALVPVIRLPPPPPCAREVFQLRSIGKRFGEQILFQNLDLSLERGQKVGILGPNGAGKSSLLKIIAGSLAPDEGTRTVGDRVQMAHFTQHTQDALRPEHTLLESAAAAAPPGFKEVALRTVLGGFLFSGETVFKAVSILSGGEKARVALARLFLSGANVLLLDEPTNHLDMGARSALQSALKGYAGTLILITHDRDLLSAVCDRFWLVGHRQVTLWEGSLDHYLAQSVAAEARPEASPGHPADHATGTSFSSPPAPLPEPSTVGKREIRQEAARLRQVLTQATQSINRRIAVLEKAIHQHETRLEAIEQRLAAPELHANPDSTELKTLVAENGTLQAKLDKALAEWETLSLEKEHQEEIARTALERLKQGGE